MNDHERLARLLRDAMPPTHEEPSRNLWPEIARRLDEPSPRVAWLDVALASFALVWMALFPTAISGVLIHL
jgi:hypothetical protein